MKKNITFEERIEQMRAEVVQVCSIEGYNSPACAVRQEALEEMKSAKYHRDIKVARQMLKQFCIDRNCTV
jgi:CP12 domain